MQPRLVARELHHYTTAERKSAVAQEIDSEPVVDYGRAYKNSYGNGFYYGNINRDNGLPHCFEEDTACQESSDMRIRAAIVILIILILIVLIVSMYTLHFRSESFRQSPQKKMVDIMQRRSDARLYRADEEDFIEDFASKSSELKNEVISVESPVLRDQGSQTGAAQL